MKKLFFLFYFLPFSTLQAQLTIDWQKKLGGSGQDVPLDIVQTTDGGYVTIGYSFSNDGDVSGHHGSLGISDVLVVKTGATGLIHWAKSFGGSEIDGANKIQQTNDGGYIFVATTESNDGDVSEHLGFDDCWVVKLNAAGDIEWERSFGTSSIEYGIDIQQTEDGGYVVAGMKFWDFWIFKIDSAGELLWDFTYGGSKWDRVSDMFQTNDKGYMLVGSSYSNDGDVTGHHGTTDFEDYWVVKVDSTGVIEWEKSLGGSYLDAAGVGIQTHDGAYIIAGSSYSNNGDVSGHHGPSPGNAFDDAWIVKLEGDGNILWQKSLGGTGNETMYSIIETAGGSYMLSGWTGSSDGDVTDVLSGGLDAWIVQFSPDGIIEWQQLLGGSELDIFNSLKTTSDGSFVFCGVSKSTDGVVMGAGNGGEDFWIGKLNITTSVGENPSELIKLFPNPTSGVIDLIPDSNDPIMHVFLSDLLGNQLFDKKTNNTEVLDISAYADGLYLISGKTKSGRILQGKILKQ